MCSTVGVKPKIWSVEFLRIVFLLFIILGHCMERYPQVRADVLSFFGSAQMRTWFGVEFFFILGGFFLYRKFGQSIGASIRKIYTRLLPALLFVFVLTTLTSEVSFSDFPSILTLTTGLSIPGEVTGWGDWYVGVYFWCSCLYLVIFSLPRARAFCWMGILMYVSLVLKFHGKNTGFITTYFSLIGSEVVRGLFSVGVGILAAAASQNIQYKRNKIAAVFFSVLEIYCIAQVLNYIVSRQHWSIDLWNIELTFGLFLFSAASSYGYVSRWLNNRAWVEHLSRYTYSVFLAHIVFIRILVVHHNLGLSEWACVAFCIRGCRFAWYI